MAWDTASAMASRRRGVTFAARLWAIILGACLASIAAMSAAAALQMARLNRDASLSSLAVAAAALGNAADLSDPGGFCRQAAAGTPLRLTLIGPDGTVLGDSRGEAASMENHAARPEVAAALAGEPGQSVRESPTLGGDMAYAAVPLFRDGVLAGVLRAAMDLPDLGARMGPFMLWSLGVALALAASAAMAARAAGKRLGGPIASLSRAADAWAAGSLEVRAPASGLPELATLAGALNAMAAELASRMEQSDRLGHELRAVLDAMGEGLMALDPQLRVTLANPLAAGTFRAAEGPAGAMEGLHVLEATGSAALGELAARCAESGARQEAELRVFGPAGTRMLEVVAEPLPWPEGRSGVVLVLNDLTRTRHLETVRRDFVSNVSHELRTPITLIKGFLEAMQGASAEDAARFVGIMRRHADRMGAMVEDLLTLARLESAERPGLVLRETDALELIRRSVETMDLDARAKDATIRVEAPAGLRVQASEGLLEQALVNLLQNALRYGPTGAEVRVSAAPGPTGMVSFTVADRGPGIPERDRERIFERFYRLDRARGRELGGTGLGLAIVRHITLAHGGRVSLESREGEGSAFTVSVPAAGSAPSAGSGPASAQANEPSPSIDTARQ